ncbi:MAG: DNA methyltransferase [DPANN group archaeon]|nr:DNA methyltransferase [DPANN group archaeon]
MTPELNGLVSFVADLTKNDQRYRQGLLFDLEQGRTESRVNEKSSSTFSPNMSVTIHRWFRYSAGFSADWVRTVISHEIENHSVRVLDPFAGSGTTLIEAEKIGVESWGIEAHPFIFRVAHSKLLWRTDSAAYLQKAHELLKAAEKMQPDLSAYPLLIRKCFDDFSLSRLDVFRQAFEKIKDTSPASELLWLTIVAILRRVSKAGTAQWQYVLPKKEKRTPCDPERALKEYIEMVYLDMQTSTGVKGPQARVLQTDARLCDGVPDNYFNLVITSPPYPNNYDYADATRLEMCFMREIDSWGDLQESVRKYLIRSCSQHVPEKSIDLDSVLSGNELKPIKDEIDPVCHELAKVREHKGGRKTYHLMIACYFRDLAMVWKALRRVCTSPSKLCFVIGDSAPYGVYVPVIPWLSKLAEAAGFSFSSFVKTRDRNIKWKNRKHRVPLQEGRLWFEG